MMKRTAIFCVTVFFILCFPASLNSGPVYKPQGSFMLPSLHMLLPLPRKLFPPIFSIWKISIPYFRSSSNSALYIEDYSSFPKQVTLSTGIPQIFLEKIIVFIYLFLVVQGLHSCSGFSLVKRKRGLFSSCRVWASHCSGFSRHGVLALGCAGFGDCRHRGSFVMVPRLQSTVSGVVAQGLSCSEACGIFQDSTHVSCIGRQILYPWAMREAPHNS